MHKTSLKPVKPREMSVSETGEEGRGALLETVSLLWTDTGDPELPQVSFDRNSLGSILWVASKFLPRPLDLPNKDFFFKV